LDQQVKNTLRRATSFAIIVLVAQFLINFSSFFQNKLFSNAFELAEFGVLSTILSVTATISNMFTLGIADSIIRLARKHESLKNLIMTALIIFSVLNVGLFIVFFILFFSGIQLIQISNYLLILIIILIITYLRLIIYVYFALFVGLQSSAGLMASNVLPYYLKLFLATLISVLYGWTILNVIFGILLGEIITCFYLLLYSANRFGIGRFSRRSFQDIFNFSGPTAITIFMWRFYELVLVLLIYNFLGPESVGIYTIALSIKRILDLVIYGMGTSITPMFYDFFDNQQHSILRKFVPKWIRIYITFIVIISFGLFAFSHILIIIISNSSFAQVYTLLPFLFLATILEILSGYITVPYLLQKKTALLEIRKGIAIAITFPIMFILIPTLGLIGVPISLCLFSILKTIFLLPRSQKLFYFDYEFNKLFFIGFSLFTSFLIGYLCEKTSFLSFEWAFLVPVPLFILLVFVSKSIKIDEIRPFLHLFQEVVTKKGR